MNPGDFFVNINRVKNLGEGGGYQLRLVNETVGYNTQWFRGMNDASLKRALRARNRFYCENDYMPCGIFVRRVLPPEVIPESVTGYSGLCLYVSATRAGNPYCLAAKVKNLKSRKQTNVEFVVSKLAFKRSKEFKAALAVRRVNVNQYNRIVDEYNRQRFKQFMPIARKEIQTLIPELNKNFTFDKTLWKKSLKTIFPKGLKKPYLAIE